MLFRSVNHFWKITYSHTIAYFIAGILAMSIMDYKHLFSTEYFSFMRPIDAPIIPLFMGLQIFRGLLIALILLPLQKTFFEEKHGLLKLGLVMIGFSLLFTFAAKYGQKKIVTILAIIFVLLIILMSMAGYLVSSGKIMI